MTDTIDAMIKAIVLDEAFVKEFCDNVLFEDEKWVAKNKYHNDDDMEYDEELEEYNYFDEYADDHIINPLFNDYAVHFCNSVIDEKLDWRERNEIFKYVLEKANLYAINKAKDLMFDEEDNALQYDFDMLVDKYYAELYIQKLKELAEAEHKQLVMDTSMNIAISKIKRNELFNLGLGLTLSMRDCGIVLEQ